MYEVKFYKSEDGKSPVMEFLDGLSGKQAQKVIWVLKLIEDLPVVPTSYFKHLVNTELWEVRVTISGNAFRLLGFIHEGNFLILNHAFQKKTQKTPKQAIQLAELRRKDYLNRGNSHE